MATKYRGDITNKLQNRVKVLINPTKYSLLIQVRHNARAIMVCAQQTNMLSAYCARLAAVEQSIAMNPADAYLLMDLMKVNNDIIQLEF